VGSMASLLICSFCVKEESRPIHTGICWSINVLPSLFH
jgi:hypothetical protein